MTRTANDTPLIVYRVEHKESHRGPYNHEYDIGGDVDRVMRLIPDGYNSAETHQPTAFLDIPKLRDLAEKCAERDYPGIGAMLIALGKFPKKIHFGFETLQQLDRWFGESYDTLAEYGYTIGEYEVEPAEDDAFTRGNHQVAFDITRARRVRERAFVDALLAR